MGIFAIGSRNWNVFVEKKPRDSVKRKIFAYSILTRSEKQQYQHKKAFMFTFLYFFQTVFLSEFQALFAEFFLSSLSLYVWRKFLWVTFLKRCHSAEKLRIKRLVTLHETPQMAKLKSQLNASNPELFLLLLFSCRCETQLNKDKNMCDKLLFLFLCCDPIQVFLDIKLFLMLQTLCL